MGTVRAPRGPKSPYYIFLEEFLEENKLKRSDINEEEIKEMWKNLPNKEKSTYIKESNTEKQRYKEEVEKYYRKTPNKVQQRQENSPSLKKRHGHYTKLILEPIDDKDVQCLPGIGKVVGKRLEAKGFNKAYVVLGQFLVLKKHKELFITWMKYTCNANGKQASECYQYLSDWCNEFL